MPLPRRTGGIGNGPATLRRRERETGSRTRYAEDFSRLAALGLTHHRLSVEWARLEPDQGDHDEGAIRHYRDVLAAAHEAGIVPWVSLHHFTLPRWFLASGGFLVEENRTEVWRRHVDFVAETFGDLVGGWQPINETNYYARAAYGGRGWPPGHTDNEEVAIVNEAMHLAFAEASVRLKQTGAPRVVHLRPVPDRRPRRRPRHHRPGPIARRLLLATVDRPVP